MKILLTEDVRKLGKAGEVVDVADGYARNFIIPKKLGVEATKAVLNDWETKKKADAARRAKEEEEAIALAAQYNGKWITVKEKAGELFGSVTPQDVADAIEKQLGLTVDKKKVVVPEDIKTVGEYDVTLRLMASAAASIHMKVEADA